MSTELLTRAAQIRPTPEMRRRAPRYGELRGCAACGCGQAALTHFDAAGNFLGCTAVAPGTVFVLSPVVEGDDAKVAGINGRAAATAPETPPSASPAPPKKARGAAAWVYTPAPGLTPQRAAKLPNITAKRRPVVLELAKHHEGGVLARDIKRATKLPRGSVANTLDWMRRTGLATVRDRNAFDLSASDE